MEAVRLNAILKKDGEITMRGLPYKKGDRIELILLPAGATTRERVLTARRLRRSGLIGLWKGRSDIGDSATFARQLREQAQRRMR
jgi:hypothetical protein